MRLRLPPRQDFDYQVVRDNYTWADHILRVQVTAGMIAWFGPGSVIDPACGDGSIVATANHLNPIDRAFLSDISKPNYDHLTGNTGVLPPIVRLGCQTIEQALSADGHYDLVVLTEILEHLEDPVAILRMARSRADRLVASSPLFHDDSVLDDNAEHLWQFDSIGFSSMLEEAGWEPVAFVPVHFTMPQFPYTFQIWGAR